MENNTATHEQMSPEDEAMARVLGRKIVADLIVMFDNQVTVINQVPYSGDEQPIVLVSRLPMDEFMLLKPA